MSKTIQHTPWHGARTSSKPVFWQFISTLPGKLYAKIEKRLLNSFGANGLPSAKFDLTDLEKWCLERFNQIYLSTCDLCRPKETPCQKRRKLLKRFWDRPHPPPPPPPSILTDGRTDGQTPDGQHGIRKAPLPFSWRS